ncbi:single-stranded-DNA-specific exonuclease RecJ [Spirochaetia bacterium]|nr:single-stranded-DNA-specific exonuclease RecJ [Spirochaetia bacterium]
MNWEKKDFDPRMVKDLAEKYGCDLLTASILVRRGICNGEDIRYFLEDDPRHLRNPYQMPGMEDAVERILAAKEEKEKVLIFGDRDVDGITGTALLSGVLEKMGMDISCRIPTGDDPYGLSIKAVDEFAANYGTLIITVDCGISNQAETAHAATLGVDVIITDHHNPQEELPAALSIVNPKLPGSNYPFRDLSGCAVAYKLAAALRFAEKSELYGQPICLLNTRPVNEAYIIEIAKLLNLAVVDTLTETIVPGMAGITDTRLPAFLQGQQILVWDAPLQKKTLAKIFGAGVEINMLDIAPEIGKEIPQAANKSLLRIKELSRIAKYSGDEPGELDVFINLFDSFARKREKLFNDDDTTDLQLASLGTIADIMPLRDENRIIVRQGLAALQAKPRPGLSNLLARLNLAGRRLGTTEISWHLSPAINAAGRMGRPEKALSLLMEKKPADRDRLADELLALNEERKKMGTDTWALVEPQAFKNLETYGGKLAFSFGKEINRGVTGIMANRLVGRFKVPALVISFGEKIFTGSVRSDGNYDIQSLLEQCADIFLDWGGHDFAGGFSMESSRWEEFLNRVKTVAYTMEPGAAADEDAITIDAELPLSYMNPDIFKIVDRLEPYGEKNEELNFLCRGLKITDLSLKGKGETKHVKLEVDAGKHKWPAMYWQAADKVKTEFDLHDTVDMVFTVTRNFFNGMETPQLIVTDLKRAIK